MTNKIANAFAGTFAFLPTLDPTQKKQKSLQATARGQCKLDTAVLRPKRATSANIQRNRRNAPNSKRPTWGVLTIPCSAYTNCFL